jgi:hypothetical protein
MSKSMRRSRTGFTEDPEQGLPSSDDEEPEETTQLLKKGGASMALGGKTASRASDSSAGTVISKRMSVAPRRKSEVVSMNDGLQKFQTHSFIEQNYPALNSDNVCHAAARLQSLSLGGSALDLVGLDDGEEWECDLRDAAMFKSRPLRTATLLHFALWYIAETGQPESILDDVLESMDDPDDIFLPASYDVGAKQGFVTAVHIAASLGKVECLRKLTQWAHKRTEAQVPPNLYISQWAEVLCADATGADYLDKSSNVSRQHFYQPIHDAAFSGNSKVMLWLLKKRADPCTRNKDQITPLHFLAYIGIRGTSSSALGEDLTKIVESLQRSGEIGKAVAATADMSRFIPDATNVTPLEVAIDDASNFPQDHLGLLAPCLAEGGKLCYFEDIKNIAEVTAEGALSLVEQIKHQGQENTNLLRRFWRDAQQNCQSDTFASIFFLAPAAACCMLDMLEVDPLVEDAARNALPSKTKMGGLFNSMTMKCSYQHDVKTQDSVDLPVWKRYKSAGGTEQKTIGWHAKFLPRMRKGTRDTSVKPVHCVASLMPDLLDVDIFMSLTRIPEEHITLLSNKTVQGAITCLWANLVEKIWMVELIFRFVDVLCYVRLAGLIHAGSLFVMLQKRC